MSVLANSSFSTRRGTEAITRGCVNEGKSTASLLVFDFITSSLDVGLLARRSEPYCASCPDRIALIDLTNVGDAEGWVIHKSIIHNGTTIALATIEIKARVSASSLNEVLHRVGDTLVAGGCHSPYVRNSVPQDHLLQMLHQCAVLWVDTAMYQCASETGLL